MTKLQRVRDIYGPGNPIPVGKTNFFENYVHNEKGEAEQFVIGTNVPRLRLVKIGARAVAAFDDEVAALVEGLRAARDKGRPRKRAGGTLIVAWLLLSWLVLSPLAAVATPLTITGPAVAGTLLHTVDGDTVDIAIDGTRRRVRISNIDTPELRGARCERELVLGLKAKARLCELLNSGAVTVKPTGRDRWGRTLAVILVDGVDVGARLVAEGHALRWSPGPQAKAARLAVWCGP